MVDYIKCDVNQRSSTALTHHYDGDSTAHVAHHSDGRLLLGDQHCRRKEGEERVRADTSQLVSGKKKDPFESSAVFTGDVHAGVDGSGGLDGGRGVSAVHLVRLGVLSFAVDHRYAQTQALSE